MDPVKDYEKYKEELLKYRPELANIRLYFLSANSLTGLFEGMNVYQLGNKQNSSINGRISDSKCYRCRNLLSLLRTSISEVRHQVGRVSGRVK